MPAAWGIPLATGILGSISQLATASQRPRRSFEAGADARRGPLRAGRPEPPLREPLEPEPLLPVPYEPPEVPPVFEDQTALLPPVRAPLAAARCPVAGRPLRWPPVAAGRPVPPRGAPLRVMRESVRPSAARPSEPRPADVRPPAAGTSLRWVLAAAPRPRALRRAAAAAMARSSFCSLIRSAAACASVRPSKAAARRSARGRSVRDASDATRP